MSDSDVLAIIKDDVSDIKKAVSAMPCRVNDNRIGMLEKVVYGGIKIVLTIVSHDGMGWLRLISPRSTSSLSSRNM